MEAHMTRALLLAALLCPAGASAESAAPPAPVVAHLEIVTPQRTAEHAVSIAPDGDTGSVDVDGPGHSLTRVQLRMHTRGATGVSFEVRHVGEDKAAWSARGDVPPPPPGKKVVVARVPQAGGDIELRLSLTPARP
jgi:hypothetical protein